MDCTITYDTLMPSHYARPHCSPHVGNIIYFLLQNCFVIATINNSKSNRQAFEKRFVLALEIIAVTFLDLLVDKLMVFMMIFIIHGLNYVQC